MRTDVLNLCPHPVTIRDDGEPTGLWDVPPSPLKLTVAGDAASPVGVRLEEGDGLAWAVEPDAAEFVAHHCAPPPCQPILLVPPAVLAAARLRGHRWLGLMLLGEAVRVSPAAGWRDGSWAGVAADGVLAEEFADFDAVFAEAIAATLAAAPAAPPPP